MWALPRLRLTLDPAYSGHPNRFGCPFSLCGSPKNLDFANDDGHAFLIAARHELLYGFTPDSYQQRLHNVASLIDELVHIGGIWKASLDTPFMLTGFRPNSRKRSKQNQKSFRSYQRTAQLPQRWFSADSPQALVVGGSLAAAQHELYWKAFETGLHHRYEAAKRKR